uniref:Exonuclease VII large subunit n=1 Tax=Megaviridae environmental sample TaxID=1737588 RepID=A0A5J6VKN3_9VIRU|nr:MAG: exonuclease VII large subunit [Megaviridae environmental sample]
MSAIKINNLNNLGEYIKNILPTDLVEITGEISQPSLVRSNLYFTLKDNHGSLPCIIWNVKQNVANGNKVILIGKLEFYIPYGKLSLIVKELCFVESEGNLFKKYKQLQKKFYDIGYFSDVNKIKIPQYLKNILVLTSTNDSAAAVRDFNFGINKHNSNLNINYVNVAVQGINCPSDIITYLNQNSDEISKNDLILITRGGGSFEDLFGFCNPNLIECIHKLNVPVLSAIGHDTDTTLLDLVADYSAPTPSFAAEFIIQHNKDFITNLNVNSLKNKDYLRDRIYENLSKINKYNNNYITEKQYFEKYVENINNKIKENIVNNINNINSMSEKYRLDNNINIYDSNNRLISTHNYFKKYINNNDKLILSWGDTVIHINSFDVN